MIIFYVTQQSQTVITEVLLHNEIETYISHHQKEPRENIFYLKQNENLISSHQPKMANISLLQNMACEPGCPWKAT